MTLPNSSPQPAENLKNGFARFAQNLRSLADRDAGVLAERCEAIAEGADATAEEEMREQWRAEDFALSKRLEWEVSCLYSVLFKSLSRRRQEFERLLEHGDVPELYRNDYAKL